VGDEFAGRPGRCPECAAIIHVPGGDEGPPPADDRHEPPPYRARDAAGDAFDEFPSRLRRRRRREEDDWDRGQRDDFDDRPRERASDPPRAFDPHARAARWGRAHKGLGSVQIAVILYFFGQLLQMGFILIRGIEEANQNALDSGTIAVGIGGLVVITSAGLFWLFGRAAGTRVPYVPARGWARASFFLVLGSFLCLVGFFCSFVTGIAVMAQQGPNPGAALLVLLAVLVACVGLFVFVGAEVTGLVALAKIGEGLRDESATGWARRSLVLLMVLIAVLMTGFCAYAIYVGQKAKQNGPAANPPANPPPAKVGKGNGPAPAGPNGQQQQNPFGDDPVDPITQFAVQSAMVGLILIYLLHYSVALQKARRAIRAEIHRLTGPDDHESHAAA
jgi:hypothetical protein